MVVLRPSAAPVVAFAPTDIAGLVGWYDFSDATKLFTDAGVTAVTADGQAIYQANDKSGNGNHAVQATLGNRPLWKTSVLNGKSMARFDATDVLARATFAGGALSQPYTIIGVGSTSVTANYAIMATAPAGIPYFGRDPGTWHLGGTAGNGPSDSNTPDTSSHILAGVFNGAAAKIWVDGGAAEGGDTGVVTFNGLFVGAYDAGGTFPWTGDIGQLLVYTGALSVANLNLICGFFASQYALTWTTAT